MQKINAAFDANKPENDPYSDSDPIRRMVLPQANGGVKTVVTTHCRGESGRMENERDLGNFSGQRKD